MRKKHLSRGTTGGAVGGFSRGEVSATVWLWGAFLAIALSVIGQADASANPPANWQFTAQRDISRWTSTAEREREREREKERGRRRDGLMGKKENKAMRARGHADTQTRRHDGHTHGQ